MNANQEIMQDIVDAAAAGKGLFDALNWSEHQFAKTQKKAHELYRSERHSDAEVLLRGLIALDPTRFYPLLLLGDIKRAEGRLDEAIDLLERALSASPGNESIQYKIAQTALERGDTRRALELLEAIPETSRFFQGASLLRARFGVTA